MIDILIVDDSSDKTAQIQSVLARASGLVGRVIVAGTVRDAVVNLRSTRFDLVILDMNLPFRKGEEARMDGGGRLIDAIKTDPGICVPGHIVGLTEFDSLSSSFKADLERELWFLLSYKPTNSDWEIQLAARIEHIASAKAARPTESHESSIAILTALHEVELEAVLRVWPELAPHRLADDHAIYHRGTVDIGGNQHLVTAVSATRMGMASAAILAMKVIQHFRPRYLCMCGIAASTTLEQAFGDVLVASQCWDYGSGKIVGQNVGPSVFKPAPESIPADEEFMAKLEWYKIRHAAKSLTAIHAAWRMAAIGPSPESPPHIRVGPVASGASVIADRSVIDGLTALNRKIVGVEMEGYGVMLAGRACGQPKPSVLIAKSVCDFGDVEKDDQYQRYAAHTSAAFVRDIFENGQMF